MSQTPVVKIDGEERPFILEIMLTPEETYDVYCILHKNEYTQQPSNSKLQKDLREYVRNLLDHGAEVDVC